MRCTSCNYSLWNQPAPVEGGQRLCPECGAPYTVDRYAFAHGGVEFCCPKCSQVYYGTDEKGHLEPKEFNCVGCGEHLTMERCTVRPAAGVDEALAMRVEPLPWLQPSGAGLLAAWWRTTRACIGQPSRIAARSEVVGEQGAPLRFLFLTIAIVYSISLAFGILFMVLVAGAFGGAGPAGLAPLPLLTMVLAMLVQSAIGAAVTVGTLAATAALIPRFVAGEQVNYQRMFAVLSFASASLVFMLIPFCGSLLGPIAWIIACAQATAAAVPKGRGATAAVVTVVCLLFATLAGCGLSFATQMLLGS